jgi:hypothetical protein
LGAANFHTALARARTRTSRSSSRSCSRRPARLSWQRPRWAQSARWPTAKQLTRSRDLKPCRLRTRHHGLSAVWVEGMSRQVAPSLSSLRCFVRSDKVGRFGLTCLPQKASYLSQMQSTEFALARGRTTSPQTPRTPPTPTDLLEASNRASHPHPIDRKHILDCPDPFRCCRKRRATKRRMGRRVNRETRHARRLAALWGSMAWT